MIRTVTRSSSASAVAENAGPRVGLEPTTLRLKSRKHVFRAQRGEQLDCNQSAAQKGVSER